MKKIIALLMALVMVFALCACGQQAAPAETKPEAEAPAEAAPAEEAPAEEVPAETPSAKQPATGTAAKKRGFGHFLARALFGSKK